MTPTLVIMAAGIGTRFGGSKQLARVGPEGETFLDFSIVDAAGAGVERFVVVVRSEIEADVRRHVDARHAGVDVAYVRQDDLGPQRTKPWGTGHAVLAAAAAVEGPFLVCNADDYYGRSTYAALVSAAIELAHNRAFLVGFRLDKTLPSVGEVARGVCRVDGHELTSVVETHGIRRRTDGSITATDPPGPLAGDAVISMNFWAFPHSLFIALDEGWQRFLAAYGESETAEYRLPSAVHDLMATGDFTVGVIPTHESWVGLTHADDLEVARLRIAELRA